MRKEGYLSQDELSKISSLDRVFISQLERGKQQPTLVTMFGLACALNSSVSRMLSATELLLDLNSVKLRKNDSITNNREKRLARWRSEFMSRSAANECKRTILLVEDEIHLRTFLNGLLVSQGFDVIEAEDGQDAVDKYMKNIDDIDLILMDIMMPRKDGVTAHKEIKELNPAAKILLMSGYSPDCLGEVKDFKFIHKPMLPSLLLKNIGELLASDTELYLSPVEAEA